ncbi:MAG: hypothetical protein V1779_02050 [bacterium]
MLVHIINYSIRALIIVLGIVMLSGVLSSADWNPTFLKIMGIVFILFGTYRIIIYYSQVKRYNFDVEEEEDEE